MREPLRERLIKYFAYLLIGVGILGGAFAITELIQHLIDGPAC